MAAYKPKPILRKKATPTKYVVYAYNEATNDEFDDTIHDKKEMIKYATFLQKRGFYVRINDKPLSYYNR